MLIIFINERGGDIEIVAASRLFRRDITVYSPFGALNIAYEGEGNGRRRAAGSQTPLLISFHDNDHYNSIQDLTQQRHAPTTENGEANVKSSDNGVSRRSNRGAGTSNRLLCECGSGKRQKKCCNRNRPTRRSEKKVRGGASYQAVSDGENDHEGDSGCYGSLDGHFKKISI